MPLLSATPRYHELAMAKAETVQTNLRLSKGARAALDMLTEKLADELGVPILPSTVIERLLREEAKRAKLDIKGFTTR